MGFFPQDTETQDALALADDLRIQSKEIRPTIIRQFHGLPPLPVKEQSRFADIRAILAVMEGVWGNDCADRCHETEDCPCPDAHICSHAPRGLGFGGRPDSGRCMCRACEEDYNDMEYENGCSD